MDCQSNSLIKYKAKNGRFIWLMEDKHIPALYWCKTAAQSYIDCRMEQCSARPIKVELKEKI